MDIGLLKARPLLGSLRLLGHLNLLREVPYGGGIVKMIVNSPIT